MGPKDIVRRIERNRNPTERATQIREFFVELEQARMELTRVRDETIEELANSSVPNVEIARLLGVTRARVTQIRSPSGAKRRP